ncbi:MAG TPA: hypothetical protein VMB50_07810 [Myxococcales bacterium]|nr:hypothetical protein [Myxococcales bacterium]
MDVTLVAAGVAVAVVSAVVMRALVKGQRKKVETALELLKTRGPMTLDEIAAETGTNVVMKGYLMQALDAMTAKGGLTKIPPPPGHPRLRLFRDTKYALPTQAA